MGGYGDTVAGEGGGCRLGGGVGAGWETDACEAVGGEAGGWAGGGA